MGTLQKTKVQLSSFLHPSAKNPASTCEDVSANQREKMRVIDRQTLWQQTWFA